ncbi:MAG: MBL fold metallo-hydrolase [Desulfomonile sp.]|jgi:7,8-dihydropterin-6-yl-methyl-4-(beta-D-ribofuranosyl)aminobenzene 5'-phosphate synthase
MQTVGRRDFLKTVAIGGALLSLDSAFMAQHIAAGPHDLKAIGECKSISIKCISEVGWWDNQIILADLMKAGGPKEADQWTSEWSASNAAGSCSLVEVESLAGSKTRFLVDTGWDVKYMDERFKAEGVDRMLKNGEIDFLYVTHEHLDHFWGLEAILKYNPEIKIIIPNSFQPPAISYLGGADFAKAAAKNSIQHKGELIKFRVGEITKLMEGVVSVGFDIPIILKIRGEQSLYFNVKDAGLVLFTGCCHQNILAFADYALNNLNAREKLYGLYGGLHIAPFGKLGDEERGWIEKMGSYGFKKIAANHCTGLLGVQRMVELGYPLVKGTGSKGSQSDLYVGNGDSVVFG